MPESVESLVMKAHQTMLNGVANLPSYPVTQSGFPEGDDARESEVINRWADPELLEQDLGKPYLRN